MIGSFNVRPTCTATMVMTTCWPPLSARNDITELKYRPSPSSEYIQNQNTFFISSTESNTGYARNLATINKIASLPDNWNGYGASAFPPRLIERIRLIITTLTHQPEIFPTAADSIQLEYEKENGDYLEFEIYENGDIQVFQERLNGEESTTEIIHDWQQIDRFVRDFYEPAF